MGQESKKDHGHCVKIATLSSSYITVKETVSRCDKSSFYGLDGTFDYSSDDSNDNSTDDAIDCLIEELERAENEDGDKSNKVTPLSLRHLHQLIITHNLPYKIGEEETPGDGNCFLSAVLQNLISLKDNKLWEKQIPDDVDELRAQVIEFMKTEREYWTRPRYNSTNNLFEDGPFSKDIDIADTQFDELISLQEKHDAWTDEEGFMVEATALFLECQINVLQTGIQGHVTADGISGPLQIINKSIRNEKPILNLGLVKDLENHNGHYQFIYYSSEGPPMEYSPPTLKFPQPRRNIQKDFQISDCFCNTTRHTCQICKERVCIACSVENIDENDENKRYHRTCLDSESVTTAKTLRAPKSPCSKYLSSSSAKKIKKSHCHFCKRDVEKLQLEMHLKQSQSCSIRYFRKYKVNTIDAILFEVYDCLYCEKESINRLRDHLNRSPNCLQNYFKKFRKGNIEQLFKKIILVKRQSHKSRQNLSRKMESQKKQRNKENDIKTIETSLNDFRRNIQFGNYKLCVKCLTNTTEYMAEEIKHGTELYDEEKLNENLKRKLLRFGKFWICLKCKKKENKTNKESKIEMKPFNVDGRTTFIPKICLNDRLEEMFIKKTMFSPKTVQGLDDSGADNNISQHKNLSQKMNKNIPIESEDINQLYENQLYKYKVSRDNCKRIKGKILDEDTKSVKIFENCNEEFSITGSTLWYKNQLQNMICRMEQYGSICFHVEIAFPLICIETIATSLIQDGYVVNIEQHGKPTGELLTTYMLHTEHNNETLCQEICPRINLKDYIGNDSFDMNNLYDKNLTTHVSCTGIKFNQYIKHIIQAPNSELFADKYHFSLSFDIDNNNNNIFP